MSDAIFPELQGLSMGIKKKPAFNTIEQTSALGIVKSLSLRPYPVWTFTLGYEFLVDQNSIQDDVRQLIGFYLARQGKFDDFLYKDIYDYYVHGDEFGKGDSSTTQFQLVRSYGTFVEPVIGILTQPTIFINGIPTTEFTWTTKGKITFNVAPVSDAVLSWFGEYYFRCKFTADEAEFEEIVYNLWQMSTLEFRSVLI